MQKISLKREMDEEEWKGFFQDIVVKASQNTIEPQAPNTGEISSVPTRELEDFALDETVLVPVTKPQPAILSSAVIHTDKHSLHNVPLLIDNFIDQYTGQEKQVEALGINPLIFMSLGKMVTKDNKQDYYTYRGVALIKLIIDASVDVNSIDIYYK